MAPEEKRRRREEEPPPPPPKSFWRSVPFLAAFSSGVILLGMLVFFFLLGSQGNPPGVQSNAKNSSSPEADENGNVLVIEDPDGVLTGALVRLDPFVVNLGSEKVFFNFEIFLELYDLEQPSDFDAYLPKIRHVVLLAANKKSVEQLLSYSGKERFRIELILEINKLLGNNAEVVDLYFSDYFIQEQSNSAA